MISLVGVVRASAGCSSATKSTWDSRMGANVAARRAMDTLCGYLRVRAAGGAGEVGGAGAVGVGGSGTGVGGSRTEMGGSGGAGLSEGGLGSVERYTVAALLRGKIDTAGSSGDLTSGGAGSTGDGADSSSDAGAGSGAGLATGFSSSASGSGSGSANASASASAHTSISTSTSASPSATTSGAKSNQSPAASASAFASFESDIDYDMDVTEYELYRDYADSAGGALVPFPLRLYDALIEAEAGAGAGAGAGVGGEMGLDGIGSEVVGGSEERSLCWLTSSDDGTNESPPPFSSSSSPSLLMERPHNLPNLRARLGEEVDAINSTIFSRSSSAVSTKGISPTRMHNVCRAVST